MIPRCSFWVALMYIYYEVCAQCFYYIPTYKNCLLIQTGREGGRILVRLDNHAEEKRQGKEECKNKEKAIEVQRKKRGGVKQGV